MNLDSENPVLPKRMEFKNARSYVEHEPIMYVSTAGRRVQSSVDLSRPPPTFSLLPRPYPPYPPYPHYFPPPL